MPELDDDDNPWIRDAQYGGALGDTDTATVGSIQLQTSAIILQRPDKDGSPVKKLDKDGHTAELYKAPKIAKDPVLADDYDSGIEETDSYYSDEDVPWVVQVQVKNPLKQWWGRNLTEPSTEKQYQITVDLSGVVYGQPDQEKYYDMVYVAPWTEEDGTQNQNALYCQIYDESYRSGDMLPGMANNSYTSWLPKNNYQQIYGMDKFYKYNGYYTYSPYSSSYIYTSNPRVYAHLLRISLEETGSVPLMKNRRKICLMKRRPQRKSQRNWTAIQRLQTTGMAQATMQSAEARQDS